MVEHVIAYNKENKRKYYYYEIKNNYNELKLLSEKGKLITIDEEELSIVSGEKQINHFRLKPLRDESTRIVYKRKEPNTREHYETQIMLEKYFAENNIQMYLEKSFSEIKRRADCYFEYEGKKYNIEVQQSRYDYSDYQERTKDYESIGIKTLWIILIEDLGEFRRKNFSASFDVNGYYYLYLFKDNLDLNGLVKSDDRRETKFSRNLFSFHEFIEFIETKNSYFDLNDNQTIVDFDCELSNLFEKINHQDNELNKIYEKIKTKESDLRKRENQIRIYNDKYSSLEKEYNDLENQYLGKKEILDSKYLKDQSKFFQEEAKLKEKLDKIKNEFNSFEVNYKKMSNLDKLHNSAMVNTKGYNNLVTHKVYDKRNKVSYEIIQIE